MTIYYFQKYEEAENGMVNIEINKNEVLYT